jgi:Uma2 family endonuclease
MQSGKVLLPDVLFFSKPRWKSLKHPKEPITEIAPDLVVEILSRKNTKAEMSRKRREYFASSVRLMWEVDPRRRAVTVFTNPEDGKRLTERDTLAGGDVLPGFKLRLTELFADPLG